MFSFKKINLLHALVLVLLTAQLSACAQSKSVIKKLDAFYTERQPGNIPVDPETGNPLPVRRDTTIIIYVETSSKEINWDTAWKNGQTYFVRAQLVEKTPVEAGLTQQDNQKIILEPAKDNFLWQLEFGSVERGHGSPQPLKPNEMLLKGSHKGKIFLQRVGKLLQLQGIPSV